MRKNIINSKLFYLLCLGSILITQSNYGQSKDVVKEGFYFPEYHFAPSGDPTGLFYFDGFYYNNWGTAKSKDFVHWEYTDYGKRKNNLREILSNPDIPQSKKDSLSQQLTQLGGSGTIVIDRTNSSGLGSENNPPLISLWHNQVEPWNNQVIGLAFSTDTASSWERYENFPILDINSREFRDPKVFWHEPTQKWIMAIGWADVPKIKFYSSNNLKEWEFLSDFGPWGAVGGVWECVDLFELPIDGDPSNTKWVLTISVQPLSGQYFIGDFDGTTFTLDPEFQKDLESKKDYMPSGQVLFDFETGIDQWQIEGDAFVESPANQALLHQSAIMGQKGDFFINSFHEGASSTGKITSPDFKINRNFINFLVGGGYHPGLENINLIINNEIVRSQTGNNSGGLQWKGWDVSEFKGEKAKIQIVDEHNGGAGYIYVDHIMQSDKLAKTERENTFWFDYGPDFFAARAWNNYAEGEDRTIWTGWMSSWRYTGEEPVGRMQSIPRSLALKTFPEGVRLIQQPIRELKSLRKEHRNVEDHVFEGIWKPERIQPSENVYELIVEIENISAEEFGLKLAVGDNEQTIVGYSVPKKELYVDRRDSGYDGFSGLFPQINSGPMRNRERTKLHIFVDKSSIEVFGNDGETVISSKFYPKPGSVGIEIFSNKGKIKVHSIDLWEMESVNLN